LPFGGLHALSPIWFVASYGIAIAVLARMQSTAITVWIVAFISLVFFVNRGAKFSGSCAD